jgi:peptidoglycan L-alanyl-D-glutamate endopeptidase CwlK
MQKLLSCHRDLQKVFNEVIKHMDCIVLDGHRTKAMQNEYLKNGRSKLQYPNSKHNRDPSRAIDVAPYPYDEKDIGRYILLAGRVLECAAIFKDDGIITHNIRWGGDWNMDNNTKDGWDFAHYELI